MMLRKSADVSRSRTAPAASSATGRDPSRAEVAGAGLRLKKSQT